MRIPLLGVGIDNITKHEAVSFVSKRICNKQYTAVYTPNPIMICRSLHDPHFRHILNQAHLSLPDGIGLLMAARILGLPLSERVAGIEFGESLLSLAEKKGLRVFLLGAKPGVAEAAAARLRQARPRLFICGTHHGYFCDAETESIKKQIEASRADILIVCLGTPRQECWIHSCQPRGVLVSIALGGALDVWAGKTLRAPQAVSHLGLEWLWRMCLQPHRLRTLPNLLKFALAVTARKTKETAGRAKIHCNTRFSKTK